MTRPQRHKLFLALLVLDVLVLGCATLRVLYPSAAVATATNVSGPAAPYSDGPLAGGPMYTLSGTADHSGGAWLGSEGQGAWLYSGQHWQHFTTADGLADDDACAMTCDGLGRIWVGSSAHGVSVYNGKEWKSYDRFAGVGGSRVFCMATAPADGDVWIGTDAGLTRYSLQHDDWTTFDRSTDMPADEANAIAFDKAGNIFVGLQADGVAMAKASDGYKTWTSVIGPDDVPIVESGAGLASRLINAVVVGRDGIVYAGTCRGLARSSDDGTTWSYLRGKDWPQIARGRHDALPAQFNPAATSPLLEDWISTLAQDGNGVLWVGYRSAGFQTFSNTSKVNGKSGGGRVTAIVPAANLGCLIGTYGQGVTQCSNPAGAQSTEITPPPPMPSALGSTQFPTPARSPNEAELQVLQKEIQALPAGKDGIDFLDDDWATAGNWLGRYGFDQADLVANQWYGGQPNYHVDQTTGPYFHNSLIWLINHNIHGFALQRCLLSPKGDRVPNEFNDGTTDVTQFPLWKEGPEIYMIVRLPEGVHRVSLYFLDADARDPNGTDRDFTLQVKRVSQLEAVGDADELAQNRPNGMEAMDSTVPELTPASARTRVTHCELGVYKRFLTRGAGTYWFRIGRNNSPGTKVQGVFVDRLDQPLAFNPPDSHPPAAKDYTSDPGVLGEAARLWSALDSAVGKAGYANLVARDRTAAYRAAAASGADEATLTRWRWQLPTWNDADTKRFAGYLNTLPESHGGSQQ